MDNNEVDFDSLASKVAYILDKTLLHNSCHSIEVFIDSKTHMYSLMSHSHLGTRFKSGTGFKWYLSFNGSNTVDFASAKDLLLAVLSTSGLFTKGDNPFFGKSLEEVQIMLDLIA